MHNRGKIVLRGQIELKSPLLIGSGNNDNSDIDVLRGSDGLPFVPATSFVGVVRDFLKSQNEALDKYFGEEKQSLIKCSDLVLTKESNSKIVIRDGIKINNKTGLTVDGAKYDYEVIERGAVFELNLIAEVKKDKKPDIIELLAYIIKGIETNSITLGAKTNSGFGEINLKNYVVFEFDFLKKEDVFKWLNRMDGVHIELPTVKLKRETDFVLEANLKIRNSIIVKSYPGSPELPDAVNITSKGEFVIPGTSIKGAIRGRVEKILNTVRPEITSKIMNNLFGFVNTEEKNSKAIKGRVKIKEEILPGFLAELQTRIQIDRFTGGTINSALFDSMPIFDDTIDMNQKNVKINVQIRNCSDYEAGLMMLVLKDLWTGDLAIGGEKSIGRGVFEGGSAIVEYKNKVHSIPSNINSISNEVKTEMQNYVDAFVNYSGGENGK